MVDYDINPPWKEGVRRLAFELCKQLIKNGHSVTVVTESRPKMLETDNINGTIFNRLSEKPFCLFVVKRIKELHQKNNFDILHFHNALINRSFAMALWRLRKALNIPMVSYTLLQSIFSMNTFSRFLKLAPREFFSLYSYYIAGTFVPKRFVRAEFEVMDRIITSSENLRREMLNLGIESKRTEVIYPFIDLEELLSHANPDSFRKVVGVENTPIISYIGSCRSSRLGIILKSLLLVKKQVRDFRFILVTSSFRSRETLDLATKLGLRSMIYPIIDTWVNVPSLLAASDVYVYPGFSGLSSVDPPLTIIEAMTLGTPVVASDTGGIKEIVNEYENCKLVNPFDAEGMASDIIDFIERGKSYEDRKRDLTYISDRFGSSNATRRFLEIYFNLTKN